MFEQSEDVRENEVKLGFELSKDEMKQLQERFESIAQANETCKPFLSDR